MPKTVNNEVDNPYPLNIFMIVCVLLLIGVITIFALGV